MAGMSVDLHADLRDNRGRFLAHCAEAAQKSVDEAVEAGARTARAYAPRRRGHLAASISAHSSHTQEAAQGLSATATFTVGTGYWKAQEKGARPHEITGNVSFFWDREGRRWNPGHNTISHPGNPGVHFMLDGYYAAAEALKEAVRRNY